MCFTLQLKISDEISPQISSLWCMPTKKCTCKWNTRCPAFSPLFITSLNSKACGIVFDSSVLANKNDPSSSKCVSGSRVHEQGRKNKDWKTADKIRERLISLGIEIQDKKR